MNIIVICTDSLRADHTSLDPLRYSYHGSRVATPNLERLAADGTAFLHAYTDSMPTVPARTVFWTGRTHFPFRPWQPFKLDDYLLAEVLWDKGYTSALITDTYHLHKPVFNCGRGFSTVEFVRGNSIDPWVTDDVPVDLNRWHRLRGNETDALWEEYYVQYLRNRAHFQKEEDFFTPQVTKAAMQWLDRAVKEKGVRDKIFLWVDYFDPHEPWDPPEPYWSMYKTPGYSGQELIDPVPGPVEGYITPAELQRTLELYAGEVTFVDKWVGILLDHIRDLGIYDDTLIMWTSDHGEPFGEHGIVRKARPWNYEELVRVPWVLKLPAELRASIPEPPPRVEALVQHTDLMPTVLDALDIATPLPLAYIAPQTAGTFPQDLAVGRKDVAMHGVSVLPLLRGEAESIRDYAYSGHYQGCWSIQNHEWRYLHFIQGQERTAPELYHRPDDPYDQRNVLAEHPDVGDALELEIRRYVAQVAED